MAGLKVRLITHVQAMIERIAVQALALALSGLEGRQSFVVTFKK